MNANSDPMDVDELEKARDNEDDDEEEDRSDQLLGQAVVAGPPLKSQKKEKGASASGSRTDSSGVVLALEEFDRVKDKQAELCSQFFDLAVFTAELLKKHTDDLNSCSKQLDAQMQFQTKNNMKQLLETWALAKSIVKEAKELNIKNPSNRPAKQKKFIEELAKAKQDPALVDNIPGYDFL